MIMLRRRQRTTTIFCEDVKTSQGLIFLMGPVPFLEYFVYDSEASSFEVRESRPRAG